MGSIQVRLEEDVYARIEDEKREDKSFSDAIDRMTSEWSLAEWGGWLEEEAARSHRERLAALEAVDREGTDRLLEQLDVDGE